MEVRFVPLDASAWVSGTVSTPGVGFVPRRASPVIERNVVRPGLTQQREHDDAGRADRREREEEDENGAALGCQAATIPAPTMSWVPSSMRTNAPVTRLAA